MATTLPQRAGIKLDIERFDYELARRGITARRLAEVSGVHEVNISRARRGYQIRERTLRRLTEALLACPVLEGADLLIAEPEKKATNGKQPPVAHMARGGSASGRSTRIASRRA